MTVDDTIAHISEDKDELELIQQQEKQWLSRLVLDIHRFPILPMRRNIPDQGGWSADQNLVVSP